jgi:ABC-2 type transport system ATP-binding protein
MKALEISGITFSYTFPPEKTFSGESAYALNNFSLSVEAGQMHALLGPNGAGKTTLMRIITGQLRIKSGKVAIYGKAMPNQDALKLIGYAPQPISLYTTLTAMENLRLFGTLAGLHERELVLRSQKVLEETGLSSYALKYVKTYSGGMLRRLNLAVALLHFPKLLLLDEPTVGVDPQSRHHIYETLSKLNAEGMTILLCTHIMDEAQRLCSKVTLVDNGSAIFNGNMNEISDLEKFFLEKTGRGLRDE